MNRWLGLALTATLVLVGCSGTATQPVNLTVFGAASLKTALDQVKAEYEASHAGTTLTISTGSSSALRTQIEEGAVADLFLSADASNPQALVDAGATDGPAEAFAANVLTVVVPEGNPAGISSPADLANEGLRIVAAGEDVPITRYATEVVANLAGLPDYPEGFAEAYEASIVSREENVGAVTSKIDLGEGDAAIVYVTDALAADLDTVDIPADANVVASYNSVVLKSSTNKPAAHTLLDWIKGTDGQEILTGLGFSPPQ